jgi:hypothetical protein
MGNTNMSILLVRSRCNFLVQWARLLSALAVALVTFTSIANSADITSSSPAGAEGGVSAVWIFANLSFTGMQAQAKGTAFRRVISFIFGFPGTLLTLLVVTRGSERAYGIDMPRKSYLLNP